MPNTIMQTYLLYFVAAFAMVSLIGVWASIGLWGPVILGVLMTVLVNWAKYLGAAEKEQQLAASRKRK